MVGSGIGCGFVRGCGFWGDGGSYEVGEVV